MTINELKTKYNLQQEDCWLFERTNKKTGHTMKLWIITHDACEKIASIEKIRLDNIQVLNSEKDFVRFLVTMSKGEIKIISVGEADKSNTQSSYVGCIAEKRGIDRCVLKLIDAYQYGIYSETESDDFDKKNNNVDNVKKTFNGSEVEASEAEFKLLFDEFFKYVKENKEILSKEDYDESVKYYNKYQAKKITYRELKDYYENLRLTVSGLNKAMDDLDNAIMPSDSYIG